MLLVKLMTICYSVCTGCTEVVQRLRNRPIPLCVWVCGAGADAQTGSCWGGGRRGANRVRLHLSNQIAPRWGSQVPLRWGSLYVYFCYWLGCSIFLMIWIHNIICEQGFLKKQCMLQILCASTGTTAPMKPACTVLDSPGSKNCRCF